MACVADRPKAVRLLPAGGRRRSMRLRAGRREWSPRAFAWLGLAGGQVSRGGRAGVGVFGARGANEGGRAARATRQFGWFGSEE